ncbi:DUF1513 domain-containing protein [Rhodoferax saidenbachensis]|uniref:DUF1513 domain-containing protein n=1 Tax=Rhodoferax saidenbachensis TaxID=1484693 RepID=A0A1P8K977_9BURK|nr:DUF1513 domain-containing protein [Rhodoferax saidenbachensis]APW42564.1 hypothetical protein RS694_08500 [Rhodoferax saidenbachensis]
MATEHPTRRSLLAQAALLGLGASAWGREAAPIAPPRVLTAWMRGEQSWAGLWTPGQTPRGVALPARAHQLLVLPTSAQRQQLQALVLARRPGEYLLRMDPVRGKALQWHTMEDDRYLGGHAALSANGKTFFTTETDGESGQGLIAERDIHTLEKLREFPSGGIGPHALLLEPAGTLLVANGGILNLPETGRRKLNIGRMDSNLTRLDAQSGQVMAQYRLSDSYLSLRHLALAPDGTLGIALQAEHPQNQDRQTSPALALLQGDTLRTVDWAASQVPSAWDGYAGDVCFAAGRFWASAPHAGWVASWSVQGDGLQIRVLPGAGALASAGERWLVGGDESALLYRGNTPQPQRYSVTTPWDNHAAMLSFT